MAIKMTTKMSDIEAEIEKEIVRAHKLTLRMFSYLGEKCLIEARDRPQSVSWIDHTGNLRSSVGYVVVYNGSIVKYGGFTGLGTEGKGEGKSLAESLASKFHSCYALVVVAGMNYASKVEAIENKCVLASAELLALNTVPSMMLQLKEQIAR